MNRLHNEYSAACFDNPSVVRIDREITAIADRIWDMCVDDADCCPRDVESYCHACLFVCFAEKILARAMHRRKRERAKKMASTRTSNGGE